MERDVVLKVEEVSKKFCRTLKRSMYYGTLDIARSMLGIPYDTGKLRKDEFWALENVSFELKRGETVGFVGQNGSGKTTMLRLINGIFPPDKGKIMVKGRISALIAVGAGFHPHMTGRENIYLNGTILGMTRREIDENLDSIVAFADIGDFLEAPVNTYSSGMRVRLGFAIAIHTHPHILLIDEILAVGDAAFKGKCSNKIRELQNHGTSIILVSHNELLIFDLCSQIILFDKGRKICEGPPWEAMSRYDELLSLKNVRNSLYPREKFALRAKVHLENEDHRIISHVETGQSFYFVARIESEYDLDSLRWTISLRSKEGSKLLQIRNDYYGIPALKIHKGINGLRVLVKKFNFAPGIYTVLNVFINYDQKTPFQVNETLSIQVSGIKKNDSLIYLDTEWFVEEK